MKSFLARFLLKFMMAILAWVYLASCERAPVEKNSQIKIVFPNDFSPLKSSVSISAFNEISPLTTNWNSIVPSTYNDIDCLGVVVFGPDPVMQSNYCEKTGGADRFPVGRIVATVAKGQELILDVPSGPDRVFRVFGMQLVSGNTCPVFTSGTNNDSLMSNMSKPYILGEVGRINLLPGTVQTVNIPVSTTIDSNKYFEDCHGPAFGPNTGGGGGGNGFLPVGTGRDGDLTINATMFDLTDNTVPAGPAVGKPLAITSMVSNLSIPTADQNYLRLTVNDSSWLSTPKLAIDDEVLLYIAAEGSGGCGGQLFSGFPTNGFVKAFPNSGSSDFSVIDVQVGDPRWSTIPPANLNATAQTGGSFCRMVLSRVPHINNLTFNANSFLDFNAKQFGTLLSNFHNGGILYIRVAGTITAANNSGIRMNARGFASNPSAGFPGDSWGGFSPSATNNSNFSAGGGQFSTQFPGGGGLGGSGGAGQGSTNGGSVVGDGYGCGDNINHTNMECLHGKIFMGSGGGASSAGGINYSSGGGIIFVSANSIYIPTGATFAAESLGTSATGYGGGSGGSVFMNFNSLNIDATGSITVSTNGGNVSGSEGGGGGGRVHINVMNCSAPSASVNMFATGGNSVSGNPGANGTTYVSGPGVGQCPGAFVP